MAKDQIDLSLSGSYDRDQFLDTLAPLSIFVDSKFDITSASSGMIKAVDNLKSGVDSAKFSRLFVQKVRAAYKSRRQ